MDKIFKRSISNSALNTIDPYLGGSPKKFMDYMDRKLDKDTPEMRLGRLIHMAILEPEKYDNKVVLCANKPKDEIANIIEYMVEKSIDFTEDNVFDTVRLFGYRNNYGKEAINKILRPEEWYFNFLRTTKDKIIITQEDISKINSAIFAIKNNTVVNDLINNQQLKIENEKEILWEHRGFKCKGIIDRLLTTDDWVSNYSIIDLKTTQKSLLKYKWEFIERKTYRQIAFYNLGLSYIHPGSPKDHYVVVINVGEYPHAKPFKVDESYLIRGEYEVEMLLDRIEYHLENGWEKSLEEATGEIEILSEN